jgi:hypothetical protein
MHKAILAAVATALLLGSWAWAQAHRTNPSRGMNYRFVYNDATTTATSCMNLIQGGNQVSCTGGAGKLPIPAPWVLTTLAVNVGSNAWGGTEQCDLMVVRNGVDVEVVGSLGVAGLRSVGDGVTLFSTDIHFDAGDEIALRLDDPVPDTGCSAGAACLCSGGTSANITVN